MVPTGRSFVLTDVIVFPQAEKNDPDFRLLYRIEEHPHGSTTPPSGVKFQYTTFGTGENWSQHFTSGIKFDGGKDVVVVCATGSAGFQLLGYFTDPKQGKKFFTGEAPRTAP